MWRNSDISAVCVPRYNTRKEHVMDELKKEANNVQKEVEHLALLCRPSPTFYFLYLATELLETHW